KACCCATTSSGARARSSDFFCFLPSPPPRVSGAAAWPVATRSLRVAGTATRKLRVATALAPSPLPLSTEAGARGKALGCACTRASLPPQRNPHHVAQPRVVDPLQGLLGAEPAALAHAALRPVVGRVGDVHHEHDDVAGAAPLVVEV